MREKICGNCVVLGTSNPEVDHKNGMKSSFELMRDRISAYMKYVKEHGFNEITIMDNGREYNLKSNIIHLN